jgi:Zn-dependent protease
MLEQISRRERMDLLIAWLGITIAFSIMVVGIDFTGRIDPVKFLTVFVMSAVTAGIAFVLHEMAHKFTAMKYGYYAEFRMNPVMILMAVVVAALLHVVFAAPGATVIYSSSLTREQNGKISAAGPLTNLLLCIPFALMIFLAPALGAYGLIAVMIGMMGLQINAMIALFNLLPISVLDGRKVLAWNAPVFIVMIAVSAVVLYASLTMAMPGLF